MRHCLSQISTTSVYGSYRCLFAVCCRVREQEDVMVDLRPKKKKKKNLSLLSFGEEQGEEDMELDSINKQHKNKSKSAHDHVENLEKDVASEVEQAVLLADQTSSQDNKKTDLKAAVRAAAEKMKENTASGDAAEDIEAAAAADDAGAEGGGAIDGDDFASRMKRQMQARAARLSAAASKGKKTEKQLERMSAQRMEEMIGVTSSAGLAPSCPLLSYRVLYFA